VPGSNKKAQIKARSLPIDGVILDLEDAIAPTAKVAAREQVVSTLADAGFGRREVLVRVNGLGTQWGRDDVAAIAQMDVDAVLFPKVESATDVQLAVQALDAAGAPTDLAIWIMAETPRGIINIAEIAASHPRLKLIVMGTSDLAKELRVRHTPGREGFLASLGQAVLAARCFGLDILDGVHLDLKDSEGYRMACQQGRDMGFDGKTLIHPNQVAVANEVFGVSEAEADNARAIIEAWEQAQADGEGVCLVNGKLVENLHVEEAQRALAIAAAAE
jgi:citrate lyase subunit beta/citryl-CoA lyase